jgi:hypothetical protein
VDASRFSWAGAGAGRCRGRAELGPALEPPIDRTGTEVFDALGSSRLRGKLRREPPCERLSRAPGPDVLRSDFYRPGQRRRWPSQRGIGRAGGPQGGEPGIDPLVGECIVQGNRVWRFLPDGYVPFAH